MNILNIFKHLLPKGKAWKITSSKNLRSFFEGLNFPEDIKFFCDQVWLDIFPATTRYILDWERQFGLYDYGLTNFQRRDRLDASWKALGGQSPKYIQDTLQANGFDVYVHEWWDSNSFAPQNVECGEILMECGELAAECGNNGYIPKCGIPKNPLLWLKRDSSQTLSAVDCGESAAECGEPFAECGNNFNPPGYVLVNDIKNTSIKHLTDCMESLMKCGESLGECGNFKVFKELEQSYVIPIDSRKWVYFLYIGGEIFGDLARVDPKRRNEFEELCLKIFPTQNWLGMLIEYY